MYALYVSGIVNMQGFVWKFLCTIFKSSFSIISLTIELEFAV